VNIPTELWKTMRQSPVYFLEIPFEERLKHLVEEYGCLDKQKMIDAISRISEKLGGLNAKAAINYLTEGNTIESFRILLKYYDKHYLKALHNRNNLNSLLQRVECKSVIPENASQLINSSRQVPQKV
jgi:tRNA 2-selenouridine synthase